MTPRQNGSGELLRRLDWQEKRFWVWFDKECGSYIVQFIFGSLHIFRLLGLRFGWVPRRPDNRSSIDFIRLLFPRILQRKGLMMKCSLLTLLTRGMEESLVAAWKCGDVAVWRKFSCCNLFDALACSGRWNTFFNCCFRDLLCCCWLVELVTCWFDVGWEHKPHRS